MPFPILSETAAAELLLRRRFCHVRPLAGVAYEISSLDTKASSIQKHYHRSVLYVWTFFELFLNFAQDISELSEVQNIVYFVICNEVCAIHCSDLLSPVVLSMEDKR